MIYLPAPVALGFLPLVVPICLYVIWTDLSQMRIRNHAVLALALGFVLLGPLLMSWQDWGWGLARLGVMLLAAMLFMARRVMGGGDAKFLAAAAPFIWPGDIPVIVLLLASALLGGFAAHRMARTTALRTLAPDWRSWHHSKFPMGLSLGFALILYLVLAALHGPGSPV
ncbi:MAG: prepilin peptidase [Rhodobacteraceae bacterium]|nr:prepilin peptidase [Paracoccaceae bacterium]